MKKISLRLGIALIVLMLLMHFGAFEALGEHIAPALHPVGLSPQSIIVISTQIASPTAGMVMAGEMFRNDLFTSIYGIKFATKLASIELAVFIGTTVFIITTIYFVIS